jgi:glycerol uptake facilitator-like aquaporin
MESLDYINGHEKVKDPSKCKAWLAVFVYEMYATSMLVYAVTMQSNTVAIPLTLLAMILIIGPLTGGHVNPAVTSGTFMVRLGSNSDHHSVVTDLVMSVWMMVAQFVGGCLGAFMYLGTFSGGKVPTGFAMLYPAT